MAGRAIWKGYIHFGDVNVPVKLHSAVKEERIQFHLLHKPDRIKLKQQMVCAYEKLPVPAEEQIRGFELEDGKYIPIDPAELEEIAPENSRIIEVHEFVRTEQIDPIFRDRVYYLEPDTYSKEYNALMTALTEMDAEGVCTWIMRKRSYHGSLQTNGKILRLNTLRYADEVIPPKSLGLKEITLSEKELKVGSDLIDKLSAPFRPQKFSNEHQEKLQKLIDQKVRGEKIAILRPRHLKATAPNKLLQTLEASIKKVA
jgi:DNA end-binding protein Ku